METMILIINWLVYGGLFGTFFIKFTDQKERDKYRRFAYFALMLCSLFLSVFLFKQAFLAEKIQVKLNILETIFNAFLLFFMWTKVKEDKLFSNLNKK
jgi:uncharacterized membrane protein YozB (DUF420 family)